MTYPDQKPDAFQDVFFINPAGMMSLGQFLPYSHYHRRDTFKDYHSEEIWEAKDISWWEPVVFPKIVKNNNNDNI